MNSPPKIPHDREGQASHLNRAMVHCHLEIKKFAEEVCVSESAVRAWKSGRCKMGGASRTLSDYVLLQYWPRDEAGYIPLPELSVIPALKHKGKPLASRELNAALFELRELMREAAVQRGVIVSQLDKLAVEVLELTCLRDASAG